MPVEMHIHSDFLVGNDHFFSNQLFFLKQDCLLMIACTWAFKRQSNAC